MSEKKLMSERQFDSESKRRERVNADEKSSKPHETKRDQTQKINEILDLATKADILQGEISELSEEIASLINSLPEDERKNLYLAAGVPEVLEDKENIEHRPVGFRSTPRVAQGNHKKSSIGFLGELKKKD